MDGRRMERREVFVQGKSFAAAAIFFFDGEKSGEKRERGVSQGPFCKPVTSIINY
jgi:hypothetical protein